MNLLQPVRLIVVQHSPSFDPINASACLPAGTARGDGHVAATHSLGDSHHAGPRPGLGDLKQPGVCHTVRGDRLVGACSLELLLNSTGEGIYQTDENGRCAFVNRAGAEMLGYTPAELIGQRVHDIVHSRKADGSAYPLDCCPIYRASTLGEACRVDSEVFWRRDGTPLPVEYSAHPIIENGKVSGAVVSFTDITRRKQLEAQLRQAQKMESVGQLAGGVAHDFNNIITVIQGHASMVETTPAIPPSVAQSVREIMVAANRAARLTRQLLTFSRRQPIQPRNLNLTEVVEGVMRMLRCVLGEDVSLHFIACPLPPIYADAGMIEQILMNLAVNARHAMPRGGSLTISTSRQSIGDEAKQHNPDAAPGRYVCLSLADTGCGIPPENLEKIFQPFFTTKQATDGTGLGLATVDGIARQHGGWVTVQSEINKGTTFTVYFPVPSA